MNTRASVLAICGGVGGAKLALGLQRVLPQGSLAVLVNTGDDFQHLGLAVSPDVDTVLYTLASIADPVRGWGRANESWNFHEELVRRGGPEWFQLGDRDLVVHVERTHRLASGEPLSSITADLGHRFGVGNPVLPMSDDPVRTMLETDAGMLAFQDYFVRRRCEPAVSAIHYNGASNALPNSLALELLESKALQAVVVCPSNPWLSIGPILSIPGLRCALQRCRVPIVAVSPVMSGQSFKGPTAKLMRELGLAVTVKSIAEHYDGVIDGIVMDERDEAGTDSIRIPAVRERIFMETLEDREELARRVLTFAGALRLTNAMRRAS